jgi:hypothetical protein
MVWHREFGHLSLSVIRAYADRHKGRAITEHGRKVLHSFNARPRIRIRQDGFIRHDGGECPVPPWTRVEIEVEDEAVASRRSVECYELMLKECGADLLIDLDNARQAARTALQSHRGEGR